MTQPPDIPAPDAPVDDGPQIRVRSVFPTPIAVIAVPGAAELNPPLEARVLERERTDPGIEHSSWGGWQSATDLPNWGGPECAEIMRLARDAARELTSDRNGTRVQGLRWQMLAWANVNRQGSANTQHTHPGAYWTAVYYIRDGGAGRTRDIGGELEIHDPRGPGPGMLAPHLAFSSKGGLSVGGSETIAPETGTLILFPAWLSHGVRPYWGEDVRISLAMTLTPR